MPCTSWVYRISASPGDIHVVILAETKEKAVKTVLLVITRFGKHLRKTESPVTAININR